MTAADDWTRTMPTDGFPQLQAHYALLGAKDRVALFPFLQFGHNYNHVSRAAMYGFLSRHLGLGFDEPVLESDFVPLSRDEATVWTAAHPPPAGGEAHERAVTSWWQADTDAQLATPRDAASLDGWRAAVGGALEAIVSRSSWAAAPPFRDSRTPLPRGVVVVATSAMAAPTADADAQLNALTGALRGAGMEVDVMHVSRSDLPSTNRLVANRNAAAYTFGYNAPLAVDRAALLRAKLRDAQRVGAAIPVTLVALDGQSTAWAALAAASASDLVDRAAFVTEGFRFASVTSLEDAAFLPGSVKYGDLPAMIGMLAPKPVWVAGEPAAALGVTAAVYRAAGATRALTLSRAKGEQARVDLVKWITAER
jgi:hypothetical protein